MSKIQSGACVGTEQGAICVVHEWQEMMSALCCRPLYVNQWALVDSQPCVCLYLRHAGQTRDMSLNTQILLDWWIQQRKCRVIFPQRLHTIGMPSGINAEHIDKKVSASLCWNFTVQSSWNWRSRSCCGVIAWLHFPWSCLHVSVCFCLCC